MKKEREKSDRKFYRKSRFSNRLRTCKIQFQLVYRKSNQLQRSRPHFCCRFQVVLLIPLELSYHYHFKKHFNLIVNLESPAHSRCSRPMLAYNVSFYNLISETGIGKYSFNKIHRCIFNSSNKHRVVSHLNSIVPLSCSDAITAGTETNNGKREF